MAIAFVNNLGTNASNAAGTTTITLVPAQNCGAGNLLVVMAATGGVRTLSSVTDTKGNTWTVDTSLSSAGGGGLASTMQDAGALTTGDTITATFSNTGANKTIAGMEFSGIASGTRLDQTATPATGTTATSMVSGTTAATTQANELVIGGFCWIGATQVTSTKGASYTALLEADENAGADLGCSIEYKIVSSTGTQSADATLSSAGTNWTAFIATYFAGATVTPAPVGPGPLLFASRPPRIPGSQAILQPQPVSGNAPVTVFPPEGDVTTAGQVPVMLDTRLPAEGDVTAAGQVPALLVTYDAIPVAVATAAAGVPLMEVSADAAVFPLPLGLAGGIRRIPGSQAILRPQEVGADPLPATIYAVPVASATAAGLVPLLLSTHTPAEGDVTASAPTPTLIDTRTPAQGGVTASSPTPLLADTRLPAAAAATAAGQVPALLVTYDAIPVAVATATAGVPLMEISADAAQMPLPLGLGGGLLRIPGSMAILKPQEIGQPQASSLFAVPVASATAAGLIPILLDTHQPPVGAATTSGPVPALLDTHQPGQGAVTAAGQVPSLAATWAPPVAAASAAGLTPQLLATLQPGAAVTTAASPLPVLAITFASPAASVTASAPNPVFTLIGAAGKAILGIADAARTAITTLVSSRTSQAPADKAKTDITDTDQ